MAAGAGAVEPCDAGASPLPAPASAARATRGSGGAADATADAPASTKAGLDAGATTSDWRLPPVAAGSEWERPRRKTAADPMVRIAPSPSAAPVTHPARRAGGVTTLGVAVAIWCEVVPAAGGGGTVDRPATDSSVGASGGTIGVTGGLLARDGDEPLGCPTLRGGRSGAEKLTDCDTAIARSTAARARFGAKGRSATATSAALEKRCARSLAMQQATTSASPGGTSTSTSVRRGVGVSRMAAMSSGRVCSPL